jgi:multidrug efflux pump subunit AcrA (membrane-fusion protein)
MYVRGEIDTGQAAALTVPSSVVVQRDGNSYVFEKDGASKVAQRQVQTGRRLGDMVEITSGITAQALLVHSGGAFLKDGDPVQWTADAATGTAAAASTSKATP